MKISLLFLVALTLSAQQIVLQKITVAPQTVTMAVGVVDAFAATGTYSNGATVTMAPGQVSWITSDASIATVDSLGNVTAVAPGVAIILASTAGTTGTNPQPLVTGSATVTVPGPAPPAPPVASVCPEPWAGLPLFDPPLTIYIGKDNQLHVGMSSTPQ